MKDGESTMAKAKKATATADDTKTAEQTAQELILKIVDKFTKPTLIKKVDEKHIVVGDPEHVKDFQVGDIVQANIWIDLLEAGIKVFPAWPHGYQGIVQALSYEAEEDGVHHLFHMPLVRFFDENKSLRLFNPMHLLVVQHPDGSQPHNEQLKTFDDLTVAERKRLAEENKEE